MRNDRERDQLDLRPAHQHQPAPPEQEPEEIAEARLRLPGLRPGAGDRQGWRLVGRRAVDPTGQARQRDLPGQRVLPAVAQVLHDGLQVQVHLRVQVEVVALDAVDGLVAERERQQDLQRLRQVVARLAELLQRRRQRLQVGDEVLLRLVDRVGRDAGEVVQRLQHRDQLAALLLQHAEAGAEVVDRADQLVLLVVQGRGQPVQPVDGPGDVARLLVEVGDQLVRVVQQRLDVRLAAGRRVVELLGDGVELVDPTAVEQQRQRAEHLFDLDAAVRPGQRDGRVVGELALGLVVAGRGQLDVLLAEQARLLARWRARWPAA